MGLSGEPGRGAQGEVRKQMKTGDWQRWKKLENRETKVVSSLKTEGSHFQSLEKIKPCIFLEKFSLPIGRQALTR